MNARDLNDLSLSDLKQLQKDIAKAIAEFDDRQKSGVMAALEEKAREFGFKLAELFGGTRTTSRRPAVPKYRNPADKAMTWSGRGRKPHWFTNALAGGKTVADLEI